MYEKDIKKFYKTAGDNQSFHSLAAHLKHHQYTLFQPDPLSHMAHKLITLALISA